MLARALVPALALLLTVPALAAAEFGPLSADGWPVNVDGVVLYPPVEPVPFGDALVPRAALLAADAGQPLNKIGPFTAYPYYPLLTAELERLAEDHPDLVKLTSAGKSGAGLDVWMLEIADFGNPGMKPLEEREVVYVDGGTHSNEYSGVYFVTEIAQFLLDGYGTNETATWIVENRHTFLIPMVNPDGSHLFGRLNANLVNVNRNFPVLWGAIDESPVLNNPGPSAASEKETKIVISVTNATRPDYAASIHCCGNLWLHPYGVEGYEPVDGKTYTRICDEVYADVRDRCGPIWSTIYPASGSTTDTVYEFAGSSSWGFEMSGRGRVATWGQPVIANDVREQERESWAGVMHAFLNVEKYGAHPVLVNLAGDEARLVATILNDGYGDLHAGAITVSGATTDLPFIEAGGSAEVEIAGSFAAGPATARLEWQKRVMGAPRGHANLEVLLEPTADGLVAKLPDGTLSRAGSGSEDARGVPTPPLALAGAAVLLGAVAARRRR